jgi:hypothetical protein
MTDTPHTDGDLASAMERLATAVDKVAGSVDRYADVQRDNTAFLRASVQTMLDRRPEDGPGDAEVQS